MTGSSFPKTPVKTKRKSSLTKSISIAACLLAMLAALLSIFTWQQFNNHRDSSNKAHAERQQAIATLTTQVNTLAQQTKTDIAKNQKYITQLINNGGNGSTEQGLAEAAYLIRLAQLHLTIDDNVGLAIKLLTIAQHRLQTIAGLSDTALQQAISKDITTLSALPQIHLAVLVQQIDGISMEVAKLPSQPQALQHKLNHTASSLSSDHWWNRVKNNVSGLKYLFIVRRNDGPITPLRQPQQTLFLKQNIEVKLDQAQWALLHRQAELYTRSLNTAAQWLQLYDHDQPAINTLIKQIQSLAIINIAPPAPTLQSLQALHTPGKQPSKTNDKQPPKDSDKNESIAI